MMTGDGRRVNTHKKIQGNRGGTARQRDEVTKASSEPRHTRRTPVLAPTFRGTRNGPSAAVRTTRAGWRADRWWAAVGGTRHAGQGQDRAASSRPQMVDRLAYVFPVRKGSCCTSDYKLCAHVQVEGRILAGGFSRGEISSPPPSLRELWGEDRPRVAARGGPSGTHRPCAHRTGPPGHADRGGRAPREPRHIHTRPSRRGGGESSLSRHPPGGPTPPSSNATAPRDPRGAPPPHPLFPPVAYRPHGVRVEGGYHRFYL